MSSAQPPERAGHRRPEKKLAGKRKGAKFADKLERKLYRIGVGRQRHKNNDEINQIGNQHDGARAPDVTKRALGRERSESPDQRQRDRQKKKFLAISDRLPLSHSRRTGGIFKQWKNRHRPPEEKRKKKT